MLCEALNPILEIACELLSYRIFSQDLNELAFEQAAA